MARILIIDDDISFGDLTKQRIEKGGHTVVYQSSGFGTSLSLKKGEYDLLILDVNMPVLSGRSILRLLKEKNISGLQVLLYSSMDQEPLRMLAKEQGADGYLSKSANSAVLLSKIQTMLNTAQTLP
jgi:DNA-binding response OmpR family regulator